MIIARTRARAQLIKTLVVLIAAVAVIICIKPLQARAAEEIQPSHGAALQLMRRSMYLSCQNTTTGVRLQGIVVGNEGICHHWGANEWSLSYDLDWQPAWANGNYAVRLWVTGYIDWETTAWTFEGPCLNAYPDDDFGGTKIHAVRQGYVYKDNRDDNIKLKLVGGWGCPDGIMTA